jgi:hypothetical protein
MSDLRVVRTPVGEDANEVQYGAPSKRICSPQLFATSAVASVMRHLLPAPFALLPLLSSRLYVGGGVRTMIDTRTGEPSITGQGSLGGIALAGRNADDFARTDRTSGAHFSLTLGAGYDRRHREE